MHERDERRRKREKRKRLKRSGTRKRGRTISGGGRVVCGGSKRCAVPRVTLIQVVVFSTHVVGSDEQNERARTKKSCACGSEECSSSSKDEEYRFARG